MLVFHSKHSEIPITAGCELNDRIELARGSIINYFVDRCTMTLALAIGSI